MRFNRNLPSFQSVNNLANFKRCESSVRSWVEMLINRCALSFSAEVSILNLTSICTPKQGQNVSGSDNTVSPPTACCLSGRMWWRWGKVFLIKQYRYHHSCFIAVFRGLRSGLPLPTHADQRPEYQKGAEQWLLNKYFWLFYSTKDNIITKLSCRLLQIWFASIGRTAF